MKKSSLFTHPIVAGIIWLAFTISIAFVGIYADEIKDLQLTDISGNEKTIIFIITVATISIFFSVYQQAQTQKEQKEDINTLQELNRTLPNVSAVSEASESFLNDFYLTLSIKTAIETRASWITKQYVLSAIRSILNRLLIITCSFDEAEKSDIYAANVMLFRSFATTANVTTYKDKISFNELDTSKLDGVLLLDPDLSVRSNSKKKKDNDFKKEFILPVHKDEGLLLPGAPKAFRSQKTQIIHSMDELRTVVTKSDMLERTRKQILEYFDTTKIKAFVSVPIEVVDVSGQKITIGALNIHKFSPHIIRTDRSVNDEGMRARCKAVYVYIVKPYVDLLGTLLSLYEKL